MWSRLIATYSQISFLVLLYMCFIMLQKSYPVCNGLQSAFAHVNNCKSKKSLNTIFYKYIYSKFFFEKKFSDSLLNSSFTSFLSFSNKCNLVSKQRFNLILFDKSYYYWNNIHFVREYTDLSAVNTNFIINDYSAYIYVVIWFYVFYFMVLLL